MAAALRLTFRRDRRDRPRFLQSTASVAAIEIILLEPTFLAFLAAMASHIPESFVGGNAAGTNGPNRFLSHTDLGRADGNGAYQETVGRNG